MSDSKNRLQAQRPGPFSAKASEVARDQNASLKLLSKKDLSSDGVSFSEYFLYDSPTEGIKSSQQVPLDYSLFKNHTFFNSAQANVNVAFDNIINRYPFDGSREELEEYLDELTGFEKYVLDRFPRHMGFIVLSGSSSTRTSEGNFIEVKDFAGAEFPDFSKNVTGESVLSPGKKSLSLETHIFVTPKANGNEVIFQKISGSNQGFTLALSESSSTTSAEVLFAISSGSNSLVVSRSISKNEFNHVCAVYDKAPPGKLKLFVNQDLVATSSQSNILGEIGFNLSPFYIGSGSTHTKILDDDLDFVPNTTLTGALDEVKVFHSTRDEQQLRESSRTSIFASPDLKLYFKFNEPSGSFGDNSIVLDSSGNSLHSKITNYALYNRTTSSFPQALSSENSEFNPVLFPRFNPVIDLNLDLLSSASQYDDANPNLVTRLVPDHYLIEGQDYFGFEKLEGNLDQPLTGTSIPGSAKLGSTQVFSSLLFTYGKFFDELKIALDQFSSLLQPSYDSNEGVSYMFLPFLADHYGIELPPILTDATAGQYYHGENTQNEYVDIEQSLQKIRSQLLKRMLVNIRDIVNSKGTVGSVKAVLRNLGLDPDILVRIREYGGPRRFELSENRVKRAIIFPRLSFSGAASNLIKTPVNAQGFAAGSPRIISGYLSGSRLEVGFPRQQGPMVEVGTSIGGVHGISSRKADGLFTSGSWTYEGIYKFVEPLTGSKIASQSLARIQVTGSAAPSLKHGLVANVVAFSGSDSHLKLFVRPTTGSYSATLQPPLELALTGVNIMDHDYWNISFGRYRSDDPQIESFNSSSYFLRCAKQVNGRVTQLYTTSAFYLDDRKNSLGAIVLQQTGSYNKSGSFVLIGSQSFDTTARFLNDPNITDQARQSTFEGQVSQVRFWSKGLLKEEWLEHVKNPTSVGTKDPLTNFNFVTTPTGSFQRLRLDLSMDQPISASDSSGDISIVDFSQTGLNAAGQGFEPTKTLLKYDKLFFSSIAPAFDEMQSDVKIRPRSFVSGSNLDEFREAQRAPLYEIPSNEEPEDDPRFTIDFSVANALNEDIVNMFATLDEIDNAIGSPELAFAIDYPRFQNLRDMYFNKLTEKVNFKHFLEFFRWFDESVGSTLDQLVPKKTDFLGVNFVIEPHSLERGKVQYHFNDQYIGEDFRSDLKGTYLLQQIVGRLKKF